MGKWIYEKWDWAVDWDAVFEGTVERREVPIRVYKLDQKGEPDQSAVVNESTLAVGDISIESSGLSKYLNGESVALSWFLKYEYYAYAYFVFTKVKSVAGKTEVLTHAKKTTLIETIKAEEGEYPDDGISGDYWYVKVKRAFPTMYFKDHQGILRTVTGAFYKDMNGVVKEITDIKFKG